MKAKKMYLIVGSCLVLQALPLHKTRGLTSADMNAGTTPLYYHEQARELLGRQVAAEVDETDARSVELSLYVHRRTQELLPEAWRHESHRIAQAIIDSANRYEMDPLFLMALIRHESRFNPASVGSHGEIGLMQIKPSTALWLIDEGHMIPYRGEQKYEEVRRALKDPAMNIAFGAAYLAQLRSSFKGRGPLYLTAYNMGSVMLKNRLKSGRQPRIYADQVVAEYVSLSLDFAGRGASSIPNRSVASVASQTFGL